MAAIGIGMMAGAGLLAAEEVVIIDGCRRVVKGGRMMYRKGKEFKQEHDRVMAEQRKRGDKRGINAQRLERFGRGGKEVIGINKLNKMQKVWQKGEDRWEKGKGRGEKLGELARECYENFDW